jgi:SNF2 family DNA or RNA helicase
MKRTKKQVGIILPDIIQDKNMVDWLNDREKELSEELHSVLEFTGFKGKNMGLPYGGTLAALLKARQVCVLPRLLSKKKGYSEFKDAFNCSSKLDHAVAKILQRKGNGNGKLVFCHFREEIDEIATRLRSGGATSVATFDGRTNNRVQILSAGHEVLVLQIQTGCEGLNLQEHYSEIYFISPHWNPAIEDQAVARCHRIGQSKIVYVERFEMSGLDDQKYETINIEKYIHHKQDCKRMIASNLI